MAKNNKEIKEIKEKEKKVNPDKKNTNEKLEKNQNKTTISVNSDNNSTKSGLKNNNKNSNTLKQSNSNVDFTRKIRREHEDQKLKQLEIELNNLREKAKDVDLKNVYHIQISYFFESENEPKILKSNSEEIFFDFKTKLFNMLKVNRHDYDIFLANKSITKLDLKIMKEIFENDKFPIIKVKKKVVLGNLSLNKIWTKVSIECFPTTQEIIQFFNLWQIKNKISSKYHQEIKDSVIIYSFEKGNDAYSFLKAINNERFKNNTYSKIKTSLFSESHIKRSNEKKNSSYKQGKYKIGEINPENHKKIFNAYTGTYKINSKRSMPNVKILFRILFL